LVVKAEYLAPPFRPDHFVDCSFSLIAG